MIILELSNSGGGAFDDDWRDLCKLNLCSQWIVCSGSEHKHATPLKLPKGVVVSVYLRQLGKAPCWLAR